MWVQSLSQGRSPGDEKWQPFLVFLPGNPMDRGVWQATMVGLPRVTQDSCDWAQVPYILLLLSKFFPKYAKKKKKALYDFTLSAQCFFYIIKADQKLTKKAAFDNVRLTLAFWTHTGWKWRDARKKYCMQMMVKRIEMAVLRLKASTVSQNFS